MIRLRPTLLLAATLPGTLGCPGSRRPEADPPGQVWRLPRQPTDTIVSDVEFRVVLTHPHPDTVLARVRVRNVGRDSVALGGSGCSASLRLFDSEADVTTATSAGTLRFDWLQHLDRRARALGGQLGCAEYLAGYPLAPGDTAWPRDYVSPMPLTAPELVALAAGRYAARLRLRVFRLEYRYPDPRWADTVEVPAGTLEIER